MKKFWIFWDKRGSYEKAILGMLAAFILFCFGYFSGRMYYSSKCDICKLTLRQGEHYILDVRTGEVLALSDYIDRESDILWFSGIGQLPQEASVTRRLGYIRFPGQAPATARYCKNHTSGLDPDFLVLSPGETGTVCYAVLDGQTLDPDGRIITKYMNEALGCWELEIEWDSTTDIS